MSDKRISICTADARRCGIHPCRVSRSGIVQSRASDEKVKLEKLAEGAKVVLKLVIVFVETAYDAACTFVDKAVAPHNTKTAGTIENTLRFTSTSRLFIDIPYPQFSTQF